MKNTRFLYFLCFSIVMEFAEHTIKINQHMTLKVHIPLELDILSLEGILLQCRNIVKHSSMGFHVEKSVQKKISSDIEWNEEKHSMIKKWRKEGKTISEMALLFLKQFPCDISLKLLQGRIYARFKLLDKKR